MPAVVARRAPAAVVPEVPTRAAALVVQSAGEVPSLAAMTAVVVPAAAVACRPGTEDSVSRK
jgi:hypothetical protein